MSLLRREAATTVAQFFPPRATIGRATVSVTTDEALRQSVVWAGLRLRASLVSLMPVDVYRRLGDGTRISVNAPPVLVSPDTFADEKPIRIGQWLYAAEMSKGSWGNHLGVIRQVDGAGRPSQIETVQPKDVRMTIKGTRITHYYFGGEEIPSKYVWHERRNLLPGVPVGLSPFQYAALAIAGAAGAQQFATDWFNGGAIPSAHLKNIERKLAPGAADAIKARFVDTVRSGEPFVTGKDWTYDPLQAKAAESGFIEQLQMTAQDLCRFIGVPGDMVDVAQSGQSITYANLTQRNLQMMVINMGPDVKDHEDALTGLTPAPQYVKLNSSAVLRMDDKSRADLNEVLIRSRQATPTETRSFEDRAPFTPEDLAEFDRLFGKPGKELSPSEVSQKAYLAVGAGVLSKHEAREMIRAAGANLDPAKIPTEGAA